MRVFIYDEDRAVYAEIEGHRPMPFYRCSEVQSLGQCFVNAIEWALQEGATVAEFRDPRVSEG